MRTRKRQKHEDEQTEGGGEVQGRNACMFIVIF